MVRLRTEITAVWLGNTYYIMFFSKILLSCRNKSGQVRGSFSEQSLKLDKSEFMVPVPVYIVNILTFTILNNYLQLYNETRKKSLGCLSSMEYKHNLGLVV